MFKGGARKQRQIRKRLSDSESSEDDSETREKLEDLKDIQKLRERPRGVSAESLFGGEREAGNDCVQAETRKVERGGMVDMTQVKKGGGQSTDDAYETGIGTAFSIETNKRDEDDEMMRYIEEELQKRKGVSENEEKVEEKYLCPSEAALLSVPEYLRKSSSKRNEEMLSNQMLSGIPEVDLGIDIKIKNIEETEAAKLKMVKDSMKKVETPSEFVPTNYAVNYAQHDRFNLDCKNKDNAKGLKDKNFLEKPKGKRKDIEGKPTDDFYYEKFKKQFKR